MQILEELKNLPELFKLSRKEFGKIQTLVGLGLFAAFHVLLDMYASFYIIPGVLKISFSFLAYGAVGFLYGPFVGGIYGIIVDLVSFLIFPDGSFFIGFTISAFVSGLIYGMVLYRKKVTYGRSFVARMLVTLLVNLFLHPLWLNIMGWGNATMFFSLSRIIKNIVLLPLEAGILYSFLKVANRVKK